MPIGTKHLLGLSVSYPVTQTFKGRWTGVLAYTAILILLLFLTVVNVALVGYDTVSEFRTEYNQYDYHWYNELIPGFKFRSHENCDAITFSPGDSFRTNFSAFDWKIESIILKNSSYPDSLGMVLDYVEYRAQLLDDCAMGYTVFQVDFSQQKMEAASIVYCSLSNSLSLTLRAPLQLAGSSGVWVGFTTEAVSALAPLTIVRTAIHDGSYPIFSSYNQTALAGPTNIQLLYKFPHCPKYTEDPACLSEVVKDNFHSIDSFSGEPIPNETNDQLELWFSDLSQLVLAATKLDFGNIDSRNNIFLNGFIANNTLRSSLAQTLWESFREAHDLPLSLNGSASRIHKTYLCRRYKLKSPGSLYAQVFAATSTQIISVWQAGVTIAAWCVRGQNKPKYSKVSAV